MLILFADDESSLRDILKNYLEFHGHYVTTAKNGLEALQLFHRARRRAPFDFVLSDYQMPEKNGLDLLKEIKLVNPNQRVALYSADPPRLPKELEGIPVFQKPVRMKDILEVIQG